LEFPLLTEPDNKPEVGEENPSTAELFAEDLPLDPGKATAAALGINRGSINPNGVEPLDFRMLSKIETGGAGLGVSEGKGAAYANGKVAEIRVPLPNMYLGGRLTVLASDTIADAVALVFSSTSVGVDLTSLVDETPRRIGSEAVWTPPTSAGRHSDSAAAGAVLPPNANFVC